MLIQQNKTDNKNHNCHLKGDETVYSGTKYELSWSGDTDSDNLKHPSYIFTVKTNHKILLKNKTLEFYYVLSVCVCTHTCYGVLVAAGNLQESLSPSTI